MFVNSSHFEAFTGLGLLLVGYGLGFFSDKTTFRLPNLLITKLLVESKDAVLNLLRLDEVR